MKKEDNEHIILRWQLMWFRISLIADNFVKFAEKAHMGWDVPEPSQRQPVMKIKRRSKNGL